jgi:hypothetical protein
MLQSSRASKARIFEYTKEIRRIIRYQSKVYTLSKIMYDNYYDAAALDQQVVPDILNQTDENG